MRGDETLTTMNATKRLIEAAERLHHLHLCEQEGIRSGAPNPVDWYEAVDAIGMALAAAKEEHGKHEICPPHVIYEAVGGGMICSGCEQRFAPANGIDVDGVMKIVEREVLTHQRISETLRGIRKALEANAEKGGDNLRTYPWISVEDRMPPNNTPVLGLRADTWGDKVHVEGFAIDDGGYWYFTQDGDVPEKTPTHWMPLPSPPDKTKEG